jgi:hypothetical protein
MNRDDVIRMAREAWCSWTHGGGDIKRDSVGRINWQCRRCGRWADPVPLTEEAAMTASAIRARSQS